MTSPPWPSRLLPHAEAYEIGGAWPLVPRILERDGARELHITCGHCGQSAGVWYAAEAWEAGQRTCADDILSAALRHAVMAHDEPLNRKARNDRDGWHAGTGDPGPARRGGAAGGRHSHSGGADRDRFSDQEPDRPGSGTPSEGHQP